MCLGEKLKELRTQQGKTQQQIANLIGVAKSTYSLYESGKREPNVRMLKNLAKVFNTTGDILLSIDNSSEILSTFGKKLKELRLSRDMSQDEFAVLLDTSKQVISKYETNQHIPKITTVEEYATKLGIPINYFLTDASESGDAASTYKLSPLHPSDTLSVNEKSLVRTYRQCSPGGKQKISSYSQKILDVEREEAEVDRLMPIAAHNDDMSPEQISLMKKDLEDL